MLDSIDWIYKYNTDLENMKYFAHERIYSAAFATSQKWKVGIQHKTCQMSVYNNTTQHNYTQFYYAGKAKDQLFFPLFFF